MEQHSVENKCKNCKYFGVDEFSFSEIKDCQNDKFWDSFILSYCDNYYIKDENFGCIYFENVNN